MLQIQKLWREPLVHFLLIGAVLFILFDLTRELNRAKSENSAQAAELAGLLKYLAEILGLLQADAAAYLKSAVSDAGISDQEIEQQIARRQQAKQDKNWAEADRIRDQLSEAGVTLEDGPDGTRWRRA